MQFKAFFITLVFVMLCFSLSEAKKKKSKSSTNATPTKRKTKTKTKWSTSTDLTGALANSMVASEEHGYYIKRTFLPWDKLNKTATLKSPPFLAVPIIWFKCEPQSSCLEHFSALAINAKESALNQGYLCDDDCDQPYEPICGKTISEVAVFYNECKLKVAKCRTHGLWSDLKFEECKQMYPQEVLYAENKFRSSPYFRITDTLENLTVNNTATEDHLKTAADIFIQNVEELIPKEKLSNATDVYEEIQDGKSKRAIKL